MPRLPEFFIVRIKHNKFPHRQMRKRHIGRLSFYNRRTHKQYFLGEEGDCWITIHPQCLSQNPGEEWRKQGIRIWEA